MKNRDLIKRLVEEGWVRVRTHGDHHVYKKEGVTESITVVGEPGDDISKGLLNQHQKKAGWK